MGGYSLRYLGMQGDAKDYTKRGGICNVIAVEWFVWR